MSEPGGLPRRVSFVARLRRARGPIAPDSLVAPAAAALTAGDLIDAIVEGAVERVRPKLMTVSEIIAGLLPIMWSSGTGSEIMRRIAAPMVGGMLSSTLLTLVVNPALYAWVKRRQLSWAWSATVRRALRHSLPRAIRIAEFHSALLILRRQKGAEYNSAIQNTRPIFGVVGADLRLALVNNGPISSCIDSQAIE